MIQNKSTKEKLHELPKTTQQVCGKAYQPPEDTFLITMLYHLRAGETAGSTPERGKYITLLGGA